MTLSNNSSFLNKLSTLRDFVTGMGMKVSESDLSQTLRSSSFNVELALERILTGDNSASYASSSSSGGGVASSSSSSFAASSKSTTTTTPASKKRSATSAIKSTSKATSKSSNQNKRSRPGSICTTTSSSIGTSSIGSSSNSNSSNNRLLLCKRWTVACSKSIRGRVTHGELLDFTQNWKNNNSTNSSSSSTPIDPMDDFVLHQETWKDHSIRIYVKFYPHCYGWDVHVILLQTIAIIMHHSDHYSI